MKAMQLDSQIDLQKLMVDGGMTKNDLLMQIQADLLGWYYNEVPPGFSISSIYYRLWQAFLLKDLKWWSPPLLVQLLLLQLESIWPALMNKKNHIPMSLYLIQVSLL